MTSAEQNAPLRDEQPPHEVEFVIVNANSEVDPDKLKSPRNTGTLIDLSNSGTGMLTDVALQPGDMVRLDHDGASKVGIVMWSVESSNNFRVQMRFL
jgi:hypothetical protein